MADAFDPYHEWLGIPPKDQPPHHYRLLGLEPFESNLKVIENAAEQRMMMLKSRQASKHADETQRMLNEVVAAKIVLLDPAKKSPYDAKLRPLIAKSGGTPSGKALPQATPLPDAPRPVAAAPVEAKSPAIAPITALPRAAPPALWQSPGVLAGGAVLVLLVALGGWWLLGQGGTPVAVQPTPPNRAPTSPPPAPSPKGATNDPGPKRLEPAPIAPAVPEADPFKNVPAKPVVDDPPSETPLPVGPVVAEPMPPPAAPARAAVPPPEQVEKAEQEIKKLFAKEMKDARTAEQKAALIEQLLQVARGESAGSPMQYAALQLARGTAVLATSVEKIETSVALLAEHFQIDADKLQCDSLLAALDGPGTTAAKKPVLEAALQSVDAMFDADQYVQAAEVLKALVEPARAIKDRDLTQAVADRRKLGGERYAESQKVQAAFETLKTTPDDAAAHLAVGKYLAIVKGDWDQALAHLAHGSDAKLKTAAEAELADPTEAAKQLAVADAWYDQIAAATGKEKTAYEQRAAAWYSEAVGGLTGLDRARAEKRLKSPELAGQVAKRRPPVFLDDLQEASVEFNQYALGKHGRTGFPARYIQDVLVQAKKIDHAISCTPQANSKARVEYDLKGSYARFTGTAGLHDNFGYQTTLGLTFRIFGDGKLLWESKAVSKTNPSYAFDVSVVRVRRLSLVIDCPGSSEDAATAWLEPKLYPSNSAADKAGPSAAPQRGAPSRPGPPAPSELLDFVNVDVHALKQQWTRREKDVVAPQGHAPLLQIPVSINGSYDLTVEFTRETGGDIVGVLLPVGDGYCNVLFSCNGGSVGIVGADTATKVEFAPSSLTTGKRYVLRAHVVVTQSGATADVSLDDTRFDRWTGVGAANDNGDRRMPQRRHIGLYSNESRTAFHSVKLTMLGGKAVPDANAAPPPSRPR